MMKRFALLVCLLTLLCALFACADPEEEQTFTAEKALTPAQVAGTWKKNGTPLESLTLYEDGTYCYKILSVMDHVEPQRRGGFITEGDYVVLDGYGVDDPDCFLFLLFDAEKDLLIWEGEGGFTMSRVSETVTEPREYSKEWLGTYGSESCTLAVGRGPSNNVVLVAVTKKDGVTTTHVVTLESGTEASCGLFTLTREDNTLILTASDDEFDSVAGTYTKQ